MSQIHGPFVVPFYLQPLLDSSVLVLMIDFHRRMSRYSYGKKWKKSEIELHLQIAIEITHVTKQNMH